MVDIFVPAEQEGTKAVVRSWLKKIGDTVAVDDPLVELETDKVTQEVPSPAAGVLSEIVLHSDAEAVPGAVLGRLSEAISTPAISPDPAAPNAASTQPPRTNGALSPAVRRAIQQYGVDPSTIQGTGRDGRLTRADVDRFVAGRQAAPTAVPAAAKAVGPHDATRSIPHDRMRLAIAENMLNSVTTAPHVTAVFEADFSAIIAHRQRHRSALAKTGVALTYTAYMVAACVEAMAAAPTINGRWHTDRLELFGDVNIGVGTALGDKGLVVPVVQKAQELSLRGVAMRLGDLTDRARDGKLQPVDMRGGTFTISNHGVSGSLFASPIIISQPQSAILGVGKLEKRVVVREVDGVDTIQIRPMAYVSLTIDHRVVDGYQTNAWLSRFVEALEHWPIDG